MCKEPMNPNLPHWRKKEDQSITATQLTGDALAAAQRAATISAAAFKGERAAASTPEELADWGIYSNYWDQVSNELTFAANAGFVSAFDVTEEVRKRLGITSNEGK